jgi:hypothetical protein
MTESGIGKLEIGRQQLESALQSYLNGGNILAINSVAHAAFRVLFDITAKQHGVKQAVQIIIDRIGWERFNHVANFVKHANEDADEVLTDDPKKSAHTYLLFAIQLLRANGGVVTADMRAFKEGDDPFKEGHLHKAVVEFVRQHRDDLSNLSDHTRAELRGVTAVGSTGGIGEDSTGS